MVYVKTSLRIGNDPESIWVAMDEKWLCNPGWYGASISESWTESPGESGFLEMFDPFESKKLMVENCYDNWCKDCDFTLAGCRTTRVNAVFQPRDRWTHTNIDWHCWMWHRICTIYSSHVFGCGSWLALPGILKIRLVQEIRYPRYHIMDWLEGCVDPWTCRRKHLFSLSMVQLE